MQIHTKEERPFEETDPFLRSMQFGMILLVLVIACSVAGSMIVQQREPMEYVNRYGSTAAQVILGLGLDNVFSAPYFLY